MHIAVPYIAIAKATKCIGANQNPTNVGDGNVKMHEKCLFFIFGIVYIRIFTLWNLQINKVHINFT